MARLVQDVPEFAKLLQSVGQYGQGNGRKRPLTPVECAHRIQRLMDEEGISMENASERLNLGKPEGSHLYKKRDTTQVGLFLNLLKVSEKSRNLAGWSTDGFPKIPFSLVALLASFKNPDDQDLLLQSVYNSENKKVLVRDDVVRIRKWRTENPDMSMSECIEKVLKLKPAETINHIIVCEVGERLGQFISANKDYREKLLKILHGGLDGSFYSVDATDVLISISMDEDAYRVFDEHQHKKGISFTRFLDMFLEDKIG